MTTLQKIRTIVEARSEVKLTTKNRKREYIRARAIFIHMALEHTTMSLSTIGPYAGVDHSGVINYRKNVIPTYQNSDEHFLPMLEECQDIFLGTTPEQRHDIEALKERIAELTEKLARTKRPLIARMALLPDDTFKALEERVRPILLFLEKDNQTLFKK